MKRSFGVALRWPLLVAGLTTALMAANCGGGSSVLSETTTTSTPASTTAPSSSTTTSTTTSTTSSTTTTTTTTTLPPVPIALEGYSDAVVRTVCVVIDESYPDQDGPVSTTIHGRVSDALVAMGLTPVPGTEGCDAELVFTIEGRALSDTYSGESGTFTSYSGSSYDGRAELLVPGMEAAAIEVSGRLDPPFAVWEQRSEPADAPFEAAFATPLLTALSGFWGPVLAVETAVVWPIDDFTLGAFDWAESVAPMVVPRLLELRSATTEGTSAVIYMCLGELVAREAIPADDQSTIVRALIDDIAYPFDPATEGLLRITNMTADPDDGFFTDDPDDWQPWDQSAWGAWADAQGY